MAGKAHYLRIREHRNGWMTEHPKSWKPALLRAARRRETREVEHIEKLVIDLAINEWTLDEDPKGCNIELSWVWYYEWLESK